MIEKEEYVLRTVILKNVDTGHVYWPVMMIRMPDGCYYTDSFSFSNGSSDRVGRVVVQMKGNANPYTTMFQLNSKYEPLKTMDFGVVEIVGK